MRLRFGISGSVSGAVRLAAIALLIPAGLWLAWPGTTRAAHLTSATIAGRIFTVAGALRWTVRATSRSSRRQHRFRPPPWQRRPAAASSYWTPTPNLSYMFIPMAPCQPS